MIQQNILKKGAHLVLITCVLASCATNEAGKTNKTQVGTIGGAVAGGLIGSTIGGGSGKAIAIMAGAALGGWAGHSIGSSMDKADVLAMQNAQRSALEHNKNGRASSWTNPDSGASGSVTPTRTYVSESGQNCREYNQTVNIGGKTEKAFGRACRRSDGSWEIVN
jgi:surface antigen